MYTTWKYSNGYCTINVTTNVNAEGWEIFLIFLYTTVKIQNIIMARLTTLKNAF